MSEDFGVVIACCAADVVLAEGCCASVRRFLGGVPICLIVDGDVDTRGLVAAYGAHVIDRGGVRSTFLRERSYGWGLTKMIALWEAPFATFLMLDADTVVWGDVRGQADFTAYDVIVDRHFVTTAALRDPNPLMARFMGGAANLRLLDEWFFGVAAMERFDPYFDWRAHLDDYFCSGAFFARRGVLALDDYAAVLDAAQREPRLFGPGEMGLLNYLILRAAGAGRLRLGHQAALQVLVCQHDAGELRARFPLAAVQAGPVGESTVIHWSGRPKPTAELPEIYAELMTSFRERFASDARRAGAAAGNG